MVAKPVRSGFGKLRWEMVSLRPAGCTTEPKTEKEKKAFNALFVLEERRHGPSLPGLFPDPSQAPSKCSRLHRLYSPLKGLALSKGWPVHFCPIKEHLNLKALNKGALHSEGFSPLRRQDMKQRPVTKHTLTGPVLLLVSRWEPLLPRCTRPFSALCRELIQPGVLERFYSTLSQTQTATYINARGWD